MRDAPHALARRGGWGRWARRAGALAAAIALLGAAAFFGIGRWLEAPGEPPAAADVIVLLGGDSEARLEAALDLYRQRWASQILLVGSANTARATDAPKAHARERFLVDNGVPASALLVDEAPRNSRDEAIATLAAMRRAG